MSINEYKLNQASCSSSSRVESSREMESTEQIITISNSYVTAVNVGGFLCIEPIEPHETERMATFRARIIARFAKQHYGNAIPNPNQKDNIASAREKKGFEKQLALHVVPNSRHKACEHFLGCSYD